MAYVENVAAFIEYSLSFGPGIHIYNYVDKPDFAMNTLVQTIYSELNKRNKRNKRYKRKIRIPYAFGLMAGKFFDLISLITGKRLPISFIRIKKFCSNTCFGTSIPETGFIPPVPLKEGLSLTIHYEFLEAHPGDPVFLTE